MPRKRIRVQALNQNPIELIKTVINDAIGKKQSSTSFIHLNSAVNQLIISGQEKEIEQEISDNFTDHFSAIREELLKLNGYPLIVHFYNTYNAKILYVV